MRINKIEIENFMAYRKGTIVDLSKLNLFAIVGDTGAGKSSLIDAICYALYGRITRTNSEKGVRTAIISKGAASYRVSLGFSIGKNEYTITRQGQEEGLEGIRIEENGKVLSSLTKKKEIDAYIENNIIKMSYDTFTRVIILPQGQFDKFLKPESPRERREILSEIMNFQIYRRIGDKAREDFDLLRSRLGFLSERTKNLEEEKKASFNVEEKKAELKKMNERKGEIVVSKNSGGQKTKKLEEVLLKLEAYDTFLREESDLASSAESMKIEENKLHVARNLLGLREGIERKNKYLAEINSAGEEIKSIISNFLEAENSLLARKKTLQEKKYLFGGVDFEKIKENLMEELNRYQKFLALCTEFVRQKNSVVKIKDELDRTEIKITEIKNKIATAEELNEKNEEALKQKIVEKTALEKLFSIAEETQKVQDIQNNLKIGDVCPVCGTSIERFNIQPINGEELSKVREMRDRAEIERNRLYLGTVDLDKQLNGLNVGLKNALESSENIKKNLFEIKTEMVYITRDIPTELMESEYPIIICDKKINEINLSVKENSRKEKELSGEIDSLKEEISDIGKKVENSRANIEVKKQIVASRNTDVAGFEKEWGEKVEEFGFKNIEDAGLFCLSVNEINFLEERISKYKKDLDIVKIKIKNIENEIGDYKKYSKEEIEKLLEEENKKAELVKVELERLEGDIIDRIKSIQEAETIEKQLTSLINEKTELEKKYFVLEKIQKDFSNKGILPFITSAVLSDLIKKSNIYLHKLTAGKMALVLNGEDNLFVLEEGSSEARNVNTLSGGETFLCSLALALGLKDILTEDSLINSFFIDEGFGTLDENVVQFVAETLGGLENDRNQIGIITHRRDLVEKFGDVLEIRKVRGISQVEKIK